MNKEIVQTNNIVNPFDVIKHVDVHGNEYWIARELMQLLKYASWQVFSETIERAKISCKTHGANIDVHFVNIVTPQQRGNRGAIQNIQDYHLTRYASYLVTMNGDVRKPQIADAQAYFAVQTAFAEQIQSGKPITEKSKSDVLRENAKLSLELADALDEIERIEQENLSMKDKCLMYDIILGTGNYLTGQQFADKAGLSIIALYKDLRERGLLLYNPKNRPAKKMYDAKLIDIGLKANSVGGFWSYPLFSIKVVDWYIKKRNAQKQIGQSKP